MARLQAYGAFNYEMAFPQVAVIDAAVTFNLPFDYNGTTYPAQFELLARNASDTAFSYAIGSFSGLTADAPNQSTVGMGDGLYLFSGQTASRNLLWAVEGVSFDAATLVSVLQVTDGFSGGMFLETLLVDNDTITLGNFSNAARGYNGNDTLQGGSGEDQLYGDAGRDVLRGGGGADTLDGGPGIDTMAGGAGGDLYFWSTGDTIIETATGGRDGVRVSANHVLAQFIENGQIESGITSVTLTGNAGANLLVGNEYGNTLRGMGGIDILRGEGGRDVLYGNDGADKLIGGKGGDRLYGGAGADDFIFSGDSGKGASRDTVADFAAGDTIDLSPLGIAGLSAEARALSAWLVRGTDGTRILADISGDTLPDVEVFVAGPYRLTAADFDF